MHSKIVAKIVIQLFKKSIPQSCKSLKLYSPVRQRFDFVNADQPMFRRVGFL